MPRRSSQKHGDLQLDPGERLALRQERERLRDREAVLDAREAALDAREAALDARQRELGLNDDDIDDIVNEVLGDHTLSSGERDLTGDEHGGDSRSRVRESIDSSTSKRLRSGKLRSGTGDSDGLEQSQEDISERPAKRRRGQTTQDIQTPRQPANPTPPRARSATVSSQRPHFKKAGGGKQQVNPERLQYYGLLPGCDVPTSLASNIEAKVNANLRTFASLKAKRLRTWARRGNKSSWECLRTFTMSSPKTNWHSEEIKRKFACAKCEGGGFFCVISAESEGQGEFLDSVILLPMREEARLQGATPDDEFGFWRLNNGKS